MSSPGRLRLLEVYDRATVSTVKDTGD